MKCLFLWALFVVHSNNICSFSSMKLSPKFFHKNLFVHHIKNQVSRKQYLTSPCSKQYEMIDCDCSLKVGQREENFPRGFVKAESFSVFIWQKKLFLDKHGGFTHPVCKKEQEKWRKTSFSSSKKSLEVDHERYRLTITENYVVKNSFDF